MPRFRSTVAAEDYPGAITYEWNAEDEIAAARDVLKWAHEDFVQGVEVTITGPEPVGA